MCKDLTDEGAAGLPLCLCLSQAASEELAYL